MVEARDHPVPGLYSTMYSRTGTVLYRSTVGTLPPSLSSGSIKTVRTYSASTTGFVRCSLLLERARYFRRDKKRDVCLVVRYVHGVLGSNLAHCLSIIHPTYVYCLNGHKGFYLVRYVYVVVVIHCLLVVIATSQQFFKRSNFCFKCARHT